MSATMRHTPLVGPAAKSKPWYELRSYDPDRTRPVIIGASEAAAACGMSPYTSTFELFLQKRNGINMFDPDAEQQERMDLGNKIEPVILSCYSEVTECDLSTDHPMYFHPEIPWQAATPDGVCRNGDDQWIVDAKNSGWRMFDDDGQDVHKFGHPGTDQVPVQYVFQAHHLMSVMGVDRVDFAVLRDGCKLCVYRVGRDENLLESMISAEKEFIDRIVNNDPPEPDWEHAGIAKAVAKAFSHNPDMVATLSEVEHDIWLKYEQLGEQIRELEKGRDALKAQILFALGDSAKGVIPGADIEIVRTMVAGSVYTDEDWQEIQKKVGQQKRAPFVRLSKKKVKK